MNYNILKKYPCFMDTIPDSDGSLCKVGDHTETLMSFSPTLILCF